MFFSQVALRPGTRTPWCLSRPAGWMLELGRWSFSPLAHGGPPLFNSRALRSFTKLNRRLGGGQGRAATLLACAAGTLWHDHPASPSGNSAFLILHSFPDFTPPAWTLAVQPQNNFAPAPPPAGPCGSHPSAPQTPDARPYPQYVKELARTHYLDSGPRLTRAIEAHILEKLIPPEGETRRFFKKV